MHNEKRQKFTVLLPKKKHKKMLQRDTVVGIGVIAQTTAGNPKVTLQDGEPARERGPTTRGRDFLHMPNHSVSCNENGSTLPVVPVVGAAPLCLCLVPRWRRVRCDVRVVCSLDAFTAAWSVVYP